MVVAEVMLDDSPDFLIMLDFKAFMLDVTIFMEMMMTTTDNKTKPNNTGECGWSWSWFLKLNSPFLLRW